MDRPHPTNRFRWCWAICQPDANWGVWQSGHHYDKTQAEKDASLALARYPLTRRGGRTMFICVAAFGLATILFAFSRWLPLSCLLLGLLGGFDMVSVVIRSTLVQLETPDEMRGRVSAVNAIFIGTSNELGEFESGLTAAWFGLIPATIIGGIGTLMVVVVWMKLFPQLLKHDRLRSQTS